METIRELSRRPRGVMYLLVAMLVVAPAAFAIGVLLAPADAQEGNPSSPLPQPTPAPEDNPLYEYLDQDVPFHSIQVVYPTGTPEPGGGADGASGASGSSSTLGSATKPTSGKWVYLARIQRYISLPDDVDHTGTALGSCPPEVAHGYRLQVSRLAPAVLSAAWERRGRNRPVGQLLRLRSRQDVLPLLLRNATRGRSVDP